MCGRYFFDQDPPAVNRLLGTDFDESPLDFKRGEIYPSDRMLVLQAEGFRAMTWGMAYDFSKRLLINGRIEGIEDKRTFAEAVVRRRVAIPATAYFEWEKSGSKKIKRRIHLAGEIFFMAGVYNWFRVGQERLPAAVILTREAQPDIAGIHHRMPVILRREDLAAWLNQEDPGGLLEGLGTCRHENLSMAEG